MSVKIIIEPLAERHLAQAAQLERECFSDPWSLEGLRAELTNPNARFLRRCLEKPWRAIWAFTLSAVRLHRQSCGGPAFRRQGVARALLRAGAEIAEKEKLEFLSLEVRTSNLPARRLYESEGYVHIGARPGFYTNPREDGEIYTKRFGGSL